MQQDGDQNLKKPPTVFVAHNRHQNKGVICRISVVYAKWITNRIKAS